jgi:hypothetical protein
MHPNSARYVSSQIQEDLAMPTAKVAVFYPPGERADFMINEAPDDVVIVLVDPALSDDDQAALCRDVSAMITSKVSVDVL